MAYTTIDKPSDYFNTVLYTGTGADNRAVTGVGFQPDWLWIKDRSSSFSHALFDVVRGSSKMLVTQGTEAEQTNPGSGGITSFDTNGFTTDAGSGGNPYRNTNQNNDAYVSWNWKAGTSFTNNAGANGANLATTAGSVNTDAGFSILKWNSSGMATEGLLAHGLGVVPNVVIIKSLSATDSWYTYHVATGNAKYLRLNESGGAVSNSTWLRSKTPTSTLISLGNGFWGSSSIDYIAYCFAEKQGYSKFGSYVGNGSTDGPFINLGFKPAYFMLKGVSSESWNITDDKRNVSNPSGYFLYANTTAAEYQAFTYSEMDFLSNGVKLRKSHEQMNTSGSEYVYMAFASNPFVTSTGIPGMAE